MTESKRYLCRHCDQFLGRSSYYSHRKFYYNSETKQWSKTKRMCLSENIDRDLLSSSLLDSTHLQDENDIEKDFCFSEEENSDGM